MATMTAQRIIDNTTREEERIIDNHAREEEAAEHRSSVIKLERNVVIAHDGLKRSHGGRTCWPAPAGQKFLVLESPEKIAEVSCLATPRQETSAIFSVTSVH